MLYIKVRVELNIRQKSLSRHASDGVLINSDKMNNFPKHSAYVIIFVVTEHINFAGQVRTWRRSNAEFIPKPAVAMNYSQKLDFFYFFGFQKTHSLSLD